MLSENQKLKGLNIFRVEKLFLIFSFSLLVFHFSSCTQFWFGGIQDQADELVIQFYSHDKNKSDPAPIDITDKTTIDKISAYIEKAEPEKKDCGYDGVLKYKSKGKDLLDVEFAIVDTCNYVAFVLNSNVNYRKLNTEGVKYLKELNQ
ncbi:MAG: hypothetical protein D4R43_03455 [Sphingobacteriales bacterium]|nr:MAG: hypothetical protein D4R43_03455 [Sphingobacteriales bacterium]